MTGRVRGILAAAVLAGALLATGCAPDDEAGFGLPTLDADDASAAIGSAPDVELRGTLVVEPNGCFTWNSADTADDAWIVWPDGARQDGAIVVLDSGERLGHGDDLAVHAALVDLRDLPQGGADDSYFGSFGAFCDAADRGVLVVTAVAPG